MTTMRLAQAVIGISTTEHLKEILENAKKSKEPHMKTVAEWIESELNSRKETK